MTAAPKPITGRCLCGGVTYSADTEPMVEAVCHCTDCQRQTGNPFSVIVAVPRPALAVEGAPTLGRLVRSRPERPLARDPLGARVDVRAAAAGESQQRDVAVDRQLDGEGRRGAHGDHDRGAGDGGLLHELE